MGYSQGMQKTGYVQGKALDLSGLTLQFLGYFDRPNVNAFGQSREKELQVLFNKQLSVDVSRLVFCVFIGYVLPGIAFAGSGGSWTNIAALVLSLSFHMATEIYALQNVNNFTITITNELGNPNTSWFISSSVVLSVGAICLVFYLGCAVLDGKVCRDYLTCEIPQTLSEIVENKYIQHKIFKTWVVARAFQEKYWFESSLLQWWVKVTSHRSLLHDVGMALYFQCVFVLIGWVIIVWRWFRFMLILNSGERANDGKQWCRLVFLYIKNAMDPLPLYNIVLHSKCVPSPILQIVWILASIILVTMMLPLTFFIAVLSLHIFFHIFCLVLSYLLGFILTTVVKWQSAGVRTIWEGNTAFTITDSSCADTERSMKEGYKKGQACDKLFQVIQRSGAASENTRALMVRELQSEGLWKMAAVAAISIMVEHAYHPDLEEDVKFALKAYKQARDLLEFLDCPDNIAVDPLNLFDTCRIHAYQVNLEAENKMVKLENLVAEKKQCCPPLTLEKLVTVVDVCGCGGKKEFEEMVVHESPCTFQERTRRALRRPYPALTFKDFILCNVEIYSEKKRSMECVSKVISERFYSNERELMDVTMTCLGDICAAAISQLPDTLLQSCTQWARDFQQEKIGKATKIAAKVSAIMEKWNTPHSTSTTTTRKRRRSEEENIRKVIEMDEERRVVRVQVKAESGKCRRRNENSEDNEAATDSGCEIKEVRIGIESSGT